MKKQKTYKMKIRVMADFSSSGIWEIEPHDMPKARHVMLEYNELDLSKNLVNKFEAWIDSYEQYLDDRPHFNFESFNQVGKQLAKELKTYLGDEYYVEYEPEVEPYVAKGEEVL